MAAASITIRSATEADVPLILRFITALAQYEHLAHTMTANEELLRKHLFGPSPVAQVLIANLREQPVGFALFFQSFSTFVGKPGIYLEDLFVVPPARGKGVGLRSAARGRPDCRAARLRPTRMGRTRLERIGDPVLQKTRRRRDVRLDHIPCHRRRPDAFGRRVGRMNLQDSIVVTGGGGMLAHALGHALRARGLQPTLLTHGQCDITQEDHLRKLFDLRPTLLLNCAAFTKVDQCEQEPQRADAINGRAVGALARLCQLHQTQLVHISTDFVFDGKSNRPYRPTDPVNPLSAYGRSKLLGETELQKHAPENWLIVRTAWVYGRHGTNFPRTMITAARAGKPLNVVNDQFGSPTYTVDLAQGILTLLDRRAQGIFHLTNSGQTNWQAFAQAALAEFGIQHLVTGITTQQWQQIRPDSAHRPGYSALDTSAYQRIAGTSMRSWRQALSDFRCEVEAAGF